MATSVDFRYQTTLNIIIGHYVADAVNSDEALCGRICPQHLMHVDMDDVDRWCTDCQAGLDRLGNVKVNR